MSAGGGMAPRAPVRPPRRRLPAPAVALALALLAAAAPSAGAPAGPESDGVELSVSLSGGDVLLQWTGGQAVFEVFRSGDPSLVIGLPTKLGETGGASWLDPVSSEPVSYYKVASGGCAAGETNCDGVCADLSVDAGDCGYCGWICGVDEVLPNVTAYACSGGVCSAASCAAGFADCNASPGCETAAPANTSCALATNLGTVTDSSCCGVIEVLQTAQGIVPGASRWYRVRAEDPLGDDWKVLAKVFNVTAGVNLDLYAYRRSLGNTCTSFPPVPSGACNENISGCGGGQENSNRCSTNGGNGSECVSWFEGCTGFLEDEDTEVWVEVRHVSGGCGTFDLKIRNNGNNDSLTCASY